MTKKEAIERLELVLANCSSHIWDEGYTCEECGMNCDEAIEKAIEALEQEPKRGKWILGKEISREYIGDICTGITYDGWRCSSCEMKVEESYKPNWNYCPNCGAKMEVEEC